LLGSVDVSRTPIWVLKLLTISSLGRPNLRVVLAKRRRESNRDAAGARGHGGETERPAVDLIIPFRKTLVSNICSVYCLTPTKFQTLAHSANLGV
jgi:hypothetical protein